MTKRKGKYRICKTGYTFSSAHHLNMGQRSNHKCSQMHGHNYRVDIVMEGKLDKFGMVKDFGNFQDLLWVMGSLDHCNLNDTIAQPTAEHLAKHIFDWAKPRHKELVSVKVWETPNCWAEYSE